MKTLKRIVLSLLILTTLHGCAKQEAEYGDTEVVSVSQLITPSDKTQLELLNTPLAETEFAWASPKAMIPMTYSLAFFDSKTDGNELFRISGTGATKLIVKHDKLVEVAIASGIDPEKTKVLYWSVISSRGNSEKESAVRNEISITRYVGIKDIPTNMYLAGISDKAANKFLTMTKVSNNVFQAFAKIKPSENFYFSSRDNDASNRKFYAVKKGTDLTLQEGTGLSSEKVSQEAVYRLTIDLATCRITVNKLGDVKLRVENNKYSNMNYIGAGVYEWAGNSDGTKVLDLGANRRYRFETTVDDAGLILGSNFNNSIADPTSLTGVYFNIYQETRMYGDDWFSFKVAPAFVGVPATSIKLYLYGEQYYHQIAFANPKVNPVTAITNPVAFASTTATSPFNLSNALPTDVFTFGFTPAATIFKPSYFIVFYAEIDGQMKQIDRLAASSITNNLDQTAAQIDALAIKAGAKPGTTVAISWTVETSMVELSALYPTKAKFYVKRASIPPPVNFYLTGAATEYGTAIASARKMRSLGNGKYELYTKLTAGNYNFMDGNTVSAYKYTLTDGELVAGDAPITATAGIYHIIADVTNKTLTLEPVTRVWFIYNYNDIGTFTYTIDGNWSLVNINRNCGTGGDRYRFGATVNGGTECWGFIVANNDSPETFHYMDKNTNNNNLPPQYIYIQKGNINNWDYTFKDGRGNDNQTINAINIKMNPDAATDMPHYHIDLTWTGSNAKPASNHYVTIN